MAAKADYQAAVDAFVAADAAYQAHQERLLSGDYLRQLLQMDRPVEWVVEQHKVLVDQVKQFLDERNVKLSEAQAAMRRVVQLTETQWRGPHGKPTKESYGPLTVSSRTQRSFKGEDLVKLCERHGILERLMELRKQNKDGTEVPLLKQVWKVEFQDILDWLEDNELHNIVDGAYDESEMTPVVMGAKPLSWFGDEKK